MPTPRDFRPRPSPANSLLLSLSSCSPQARNAAVRTLFLAVCSHGGKFPSATWHELFWQLLFDLLTTIHRVSATSSREEAAAVELGKERGKT